MHVSGTVTFNRLCNPRTERSHRCKEGESGEIWKIKSDGAWVHVDVKQLCYVGVIETFFMSKGLGLIIYSPLCWLHHHSGTWGPSDHFQEKHKKRTGLTQHSVWHRFPSQQGDRVLQCSKCIFMESTHQPHTGLKYGPLHNRNESVCTCVRRRMFLFPLNRNVGKGDGCRRGRGVTWVGYSTVHTLHSSVSLSRF